MLGRLATFSLLALLLIAGGCAGNGKTAGDKHAGGGDLNQLQGTWEQQPGERPASTPQRVVKQVSGDTETVTTYGANGQVLHAQIAKIKLGHSGDVPTYTFYDRRITAGPEQGRSNDAARTYVYRLRGDEFAEVWGLLPGQEQRELVIIRWRRAGQPR